MYSLYCQGVAVVHVYSLYCQVPQLVASVRTLVSRRPPLYFYGDSLGLLAMRSLNCTALHCITLYCTFLHFSTLHCTFFYTALHLSTLHCTILQCSLLNSTTLHCLSLYRNRETIEASLVFEEEEEDIKTGPQAHASGYSLALTGLSSSMASTLCLPHHDLSSSLASTPQGPWPPSVLGRGQGHASTMTDPSTAPLPSPPPPACSSLVRSSLARPLPLISSLARPLPRPPCQEKGEKQQDQEVEEEDEEGEFLTREEIIKIYSTLGDKKEY